jgi:hypothetical protein
MRRIRSPQAGEHVILEPTRGKSSERGFVSVRLEVPQQFAVDADVRKLLDRLRLAVGDKLRGRSTPALEREWNLLPITGSATAAMATIELTSRNGAAYLDRVAESTISAVLPGVIREWLDDAVPTTGDGVGTEARADTSGGPLPRGTRR